MALGPSCCLALKNLRLHRTALWSLDCSLIACKSLCRSRWCRTQAVMHERWRQAIFEVVCELLSPRNRGCAAALLAAPISKCLGAELQHLAALLQHCASLIGRLRRAACEKASVRMRASCPAETRFAGTAMLRAHLVSEFGARPFDYRP